MKNGWTLQIFKILDALDKPYSSAWLMRATPVPQDHLSRGTSSKAHPSPGSPPWSAGSASLQRWRESSEAAEVSLSMKWVVFPWILSRCQEAMREPEEKRAGQDHTPHMNMYPSFPWHLRSHIFSCWRPPSVPPGMDSANGVLPLN